MGESNFQQLKQFLSEIPPGPVPQDKEGMLVKLLMECWDKLSRKDSEDIDVYKLDRMEDPLWDPPCLRFTVERHGGMVLGSSRAELQHWEVDVHAEEAECVVRGYRQAFPRRAPVDVKPIADELAKLIVSGAPDERLKWSTNGCVQVLTSKIFPLTMPRQTVEGCRKRLIIGLEQSLASFNWHRKGSWWIHVEQ